MAESFATSTAPSITNPMDAAQSLLFDGFPRAVGVTTPDAPDSDLRQYLVHSKGELDGIREQVGGNRNLYCSLSSYKPVRKGDTFEGCAVETDKVSFDFDSAAKADPHEDRRWAHPLIPDDAPDRWVCRRMKEDPDIREAVLGDVCEDVQRLAEACLEQDIPLIGIFSGLGLHAHQLYKPTASRPGDKMGSNCRKWVSELTLSTVDDKASGKPFRIMRYPNVERVCHADGTERTGYHTIPLKAAELAEIRPEDLLTLSEGPRPEIGSEPRQRPKMKVQTDYIGPGYEDEGLGQEKMRPMPEDSEVEEFSKMVIKEVVQMPCVYERAFGRNPPNDVRVKLGIMMLNAGYSPEQIADLIEGLNWVDFDRGVTLYQLKKLRENGKGDWSCKTMQGKGLCVRADSKEECPTYGYEGGNTPW